MIAQNSRIPILDSFRAVAILMVMFFHFFSRWAPPQHPVSLYPYGNAYNYFPYAKLGVQFFFIISGFVIFFTLENTGNLKLFAKKRMMRLMPSMLIASILTFIICRLIDSEKLFYPAHELPNFIPSLSFIDGQVWLNLSEALGWHLFPRDLEFISGSYWSLWVEVQFYVFAALLYYINKTRFLTNFLLISGILIGTNFLILNIQGSNLLNLHPPEFVLNTHGKWIHDGFNLVFHLPFFCIGVLFYTLFKASQFKNSVAVFHKLCFVLLLFFILYTEAIMARRILCLTFISLFFAFIYRSQWLSLLNTKGLVAVGQSSYFLYLIHENIGVLLINKLGKSFLWAGMTCPLMVMAGLIGISIFYTLKIEKKINTWLVDRCL